MYKSLHSKSRKCQCNGEGIEEKHNYILSVLFVYEDKGNSKSVKGAILFAVFSIIGMLINMGGMWLGYDVCGINEWVTKIIMTLVVLVYNYTTRKLFIFKKEKPQEVVND